MTHINSSKKKHISLLIALLLAMILTLALSGTKADAASVKAPTGLKVSSQTNRKINLKWNKVKGADGYQLSVRENDDFAGNLYKYTKTIKKSSTTTYKYTPKVDGIYCRYYVKIRAYKVNSNGSKVYSKYSKEICIKHHYFFSYLLPNEFTGRCFTYFNGAYRSGIKVILSIGGYTYCSTTNSNNAFGNIYIDRYFPSNTKYTVYFKKGKLTSPTYTGYYSRY